MKHSLLIVTMAAVLSCVALAGSQPPNQEPVNLPDGEGKALVEAQCAMCHGLDLVTGAGYTRDGWVTVLTSMVDLPETDIVAAADYLGKYFRRVVKASCGRDSRPRVGLDTGVAGAHAWLAAA